METSSIVSVSDSSIARSSRISHSSRFLERLLKLSILLVSSALSFRIDVVSSCLSQKLSFEIRLSISFNLFDFPSMSKIVLEMF
jgi:hypothetical protein